MVKAIRDSVHAPFDLSGIEAVVRSDNSRLVEQTWRSLCRDSHVPLRSSMSPKAIAPRLLASIGICKIDFVGNALQGRYRLAGSRFRNLTGIELTGVTYGALIAENSLDQRADLLRQVLERPVGVWWVSHVTFADTYRLPYQSTFLPLLSEPNSKPDHLLDFVECDVPIAAEGMKGVLSQDILKHTWIDIGAGTPHL